MIKEWIAQYDPKNTEDVYSALREIIQEVDGDSCNQYISKI
ncbi:hypothetical protein [Sphingobacterium humi]|nr:hypothetical protein [Sphingobacterium humi]